MKLIMWSCKYMLLPTIMSVIFESKEGPLMIQKYAFHCVPSTNVFRGGGGIPWFSLPYAAATSAAGDQEIICNWGVTSNLLVM